MEKKAAIAALSVILIIALSGCTRLPGRATDTSNIKDYRVGSDGIVLQFLPGSPPPTLFRNDRLNLVVEYTNKGAFDVQGGYLYVSGYDKQYITFLNEWAIIDAKGKNEYNPLGDLSEVYTFEDDAVNLPYGVDRYSPDFIVTACYKYKTQASTDICIDPDPYNVQPKVKTCSVRDVSLGSQGAPVAVTSVDETVSRDRVQFKIFISNVGGGDVISNDAPISNCHTSLVTEDIDKVDIRAWFSDRMLSCQPDPVRLRSGSGTAVCYYEGSLGEEAYETVLHVELDYGYRSSIQTTSQILKLPGEP